MTNKDVIDIKSIEIREKELAVELTVLAVKSGTSIEKWGDDNEDRLKEIYNEMLELIKGENNGD